jgi:primosomal protein N' (replication factor Y)
VDISLPHLDRLFDYLVPERYEQAAVPGCRVRVRFAGRLVNGFVLERAEASEHGGRLAHLERVISAEPVLTPEVAGLAREIADRYGGTLADVLRLAVPPRHAAAEAGEAAPADGTGTDAGAGPDAGAGADVRPACQPPDPGPWARYPDGPSFLAALAAGRSPRAIWSALPGPQWAAEIAAAAAATAATGRGVLIVVPDARDLSVVDEALQDALGAGRHACLAADLGPAERYRRWLTVCRGNVRVVAGTRSAMFAPVARLGLVVLWDEGHDLHAEPRAPYPHAREVLTLRAHRAGAAALIGGHARTAEAAQLLARCWARPLAAARATVRSRAPAVLAAGAEAELARDQAARTARLPGLALRTARAALACGPVLFQVPRSGYVPAVACGRCRAPARCRACGGPLVLAAAAKAAACGWCGDPAAAPCARCGHQGLRALVTGATRTAEELGRAFPSVPVRSSGRGRVIPAVPARPAVIVATPGAEPRADGGYAAAVLMDAWALLGRPSLRAAEETLRRWMNAATLVRPAADGGKVIVVADERLPVVQALVRWDPATFADRELAERAELRFPPAVRMAAVTGPASAVTDILRTASLPKGSEIIGPVPAGAQGGALAGNPGDEQVRALIRADRSEGTALATALRAALGQRTARKAAETVRLELDPAELI